MYKLSFKFSIPGIAALLIFAGAAIILPQQAMLAGGNTCHISILPVAIIGVALIGATVLYDRASKVQKYQACMAMIALICLYGLLGNLFFNFWKFSPGAMVEFSWAQVGIMLLGGLCTTWAFFKLEPFDSFAAGGLERLQKGKASESGAVSAEQVAATGAGVGGLQEAESAEDFMKSKGSSLRGLSSSKTEMQAAVPPQEAVMPKKSGPTSVESAHAIMTPPVEIDLDASDEMLSGPLNPSPNAPAARTPGAPAQGPADSKGSTTGNRLQAQKRRNTSTFTKLQALSASGTGSLKPTPIQDSGGGSGDLKSLLDRLDSEPEQEDYEALPKPEEIRVAILFSEAPEKPKAEPTRPTLVPSNQSKPQPLAQPARPAPKEPVKEASPKPFVPPVTPPRPTPATTGGAGQQRPGGDAAKSPAAQGGLAGGLGNRPQQPKPTTSQTGSPGLASLLDREDSSDDEPKVAATAPVEKETVEEKPEPVKEAAPAADAGAGLLSRRFMELSSDEEEEEEAAQPAGSLTEAHTSDEGDEEPAQSEEEPQEEKVFAEAVDEEIDDIFTSLAPAEAQKEVAHEEVVEEEEAATEPAEEEAPAAPEEVEEEPAVEPQEEEDEAPEAEEEQEEERETLFAESIDGDVDDLFDNLAPAEAQRNVGDEPLAREEEETEQEHTEEEAPEAVADDPEATGDFGVQKEEQEQEEESEGAEPGGEEDSSLFNLADSDVDDIFAGLAGNQLDVNAETLKKVKENEEAEGPIPASLVETGDRIPVIETQKTAKQTGDMPAMSKEQAAKIKDEAKKAAEEEEESEEEEAVVPEEVPLTPEQIKLKKELKEFGKLSGRSAAAPKTQGESVGTMKTIGKLLIDNQAIENIIKAGEQRKLGQNLSTARIISSARGQGIMELLHKIDQYEGVVGSIIVGHDGLVMASTLKEGWDKDIMGALSTALLSTSNLTTKKLEIGKLRQMVMLTKSGNQDKTTVLTDVDVGILAVFVEETDITKIDGMLDIIHKTIHG